MKDNKEQKYNIKQVMNIFKRECEALKFEIAMQRERAEDLERQLVYVKIVKDEFFKINGYLWIGIALSFALGFFIAKF